MIWDKKNKSKIEKIIKILLDFVTPQGIIVSFVSIIYEKELINLAKKEISPSHIIKILKELKRINSNILDSLETVAADILKKEKLLETKKDEWTLIIPLDITLPKKKLRINNVEINLLSSRTIGSKLNKPFYKYSTLSKNIFPINGKEIQGKILSIKTEAKNFYKAYQNISAILTLFRGIIDFSCYFMTTTLISVGAKNRTKLQHPERIYGLNNNTDERYYLDFVLPPSNSKSKSINPTKYEQDIIIKLLNLFSSIPKQSIIYLVADALRLYSQAMDQEYKHNYYLSLWQLCERLVLNDPKDGRSINVVNRLDYFAKFLGGIEITTTLNKQAAIRNDLVHRGIDKVTEEDISVLKYLSEEILLWLIEKSSQIKSINHYTKFFQLKEANKSDRKAFLDMLKFTENLNELHTKSGANS